MFQGNHRSFLLDFGVMPFLSRSVIEQIVQLLTALHFVHVVLLHSVGLQIGKEAVNSLHGNSQSRNWVNNAVISVAFEGRDIDVWGLAEFSHIRQKEDILFMALQLFSDNLELLSSVQSFRENHVSTCINVGLRSLDAFFKTIDSLGISSCTNHKLSLRYLDTGCPCDLDLINHLLSRNQLLAIEMPTSFGEDLILDVQATCSSVEEVADSASAHLSFAESSIGISNDWQVGESGHVLDD